MLGEVEEQIRGGAALSAAFAAQGSLFPRIYTASILAGERSGALDEVLGRYVIYMRRNVALRRKIRGALAYPMFLLFASLLMVTFLTVYVVPRMSELFANLWKRATNSYSDRHRSLALAFRKCYLVWTVTGRWVGHPFPLVADA